MRTGPLLIVAVALVAAPLAGCIGQSDDGTPQETDPEDALDGGTGPQLPGSDDEGSDDGEDGSDGASSEDPDDSVDLTSLERPTWEPGFWWKMNVSGPWTVGGPGGLEYTLVTQEAASDGYVTVADKRQVAVYDLFWDDPLAGPIGTDLTPAPDALYPTLTKRVPERLSVVSTVRIPEPLFDWPLEDGKTWTAQDANGTSWSLEATLDEVSVADATVDGYQITGSAEEGWRVNATYVPGLLWFSDLHVQDPDGITMIRAQIRDAGPGYNGSTYTGEETVQTETSWTTTAGGQHRVPIEVPDDATDLHLRVSIWSFWASYATLIDPSGQVQEQLGPTPPELVFVLPGGGQADQEVNVRDPAAGTWNLVVETAASQGDDAGTNTLWGGAALKVSTLTVQGG